MREDFAALILTHGRPDNVITYKTLRESGYTGRIVIVIDDEDATADQYRANYGDEVVMFSKEEIAQTFDEGDNFGERRSIVYARNAALHIARDLGLSFYMHLDDDYTDFWYRVGPGFVLENTRIRSTMDGLFSALVDYLVAAPRILTVCISQGGDHIGGNANIKGIKARRKAMNSFVCRTSDPVQFVGRFNEDVSTFVSNGQRGALYLTTMQAQLNQLPTQSNSGGITEAYLAFGTYVKAFSSVVFAPSCVKVGMMGDYRNPAGFRLHHRVAWNNAVPKVLSEKWRKQEAAREK